LSTLFETEEDEPGTKAPLPAAIEKMLDNPLAMEALGGMMFYLKTLNLDKDLITQRNFNIYDPIREGKSLVLDGQTLGHMEVGWLLGEDQGYKLMVRYLLIMRVNWLGHCWRFCNYVFHLLVSFAERQKGRCNS
jgi:hypothetical protein